MRKRCVLVMLMVCLIAGLPDASAREGGPVVGTTVGADPKGDWNEYVPSAARPVGEELGQDLVGASISARGRFVDFRIHVTKLPPLDAGVAALPTGYFWGFRVGRPGGYGTVGYEISSCEVDRDPCPEASPAALGGKLPFVVYQCNWFSLATAGCTRIGSAVATTDARAATITVAVPRDLIGAEAGTHITGEEAFGAALFSYTVIPITGTQTDPRKPVGDSLRPTKPFIVPRR